MHEFPYYVIRKTNRTFPHLWEVDPYTYSDIRMARVYRGDYLTEVQSEIWAVDPYTMEAEKIE